MRPPQDIPVAHIRASATARQVKIGQVMVLAESIKQIGLRQPINVRPVQGGYEVRGGGHRLEAFRMLGRETIPAFVCDDDDLHAELAEIDENYCRADLSPAERALFMSRRKAIYEALHPETRQHIAGGKARQDAASDNLSFAEDAARKTGKNRRTVERDTHRGGELGEETIKAVIGTSLDKGEELDALAKLSPEKRGELIDRATAGDKVSAKIAAKKEKRSDREDQLGKEIAALPDERHGFIAADPEWHFKPWSNETGMDRAAENHYPTSPDEEIAARRKLIDEIAAPDCVCALWVTDLARGIDTLRAWGFEYKSYFVWLKNLSEVDLTPEQKKTGFGNARVFMHMGAPGMGYWNRDEDELLLIGTRGSPVCPAQGEQGPSTWFEIKRLHSQKPECFYEWVNKHFPNTPRIELNARRRRPGWQAWGNEVESTRPERIAIEREVLKRGLIERADMVRTSASSIVPFHYVTDDEWQALLDAPVGELPDAQVIAQPCNDQSAILNPESESDVETLASPVGEEPAAIDAPCAVAAGSDVQDEGDGLDIPGFLRRMAS